MYRNESVKRKPLQWLLASFSIGLAAMPLFAAQPAHASGDETSTTISSSGSPSTYGDELTLTAVVTSGVSTPTGTVEFRSGADPIGSAELTEEGEACFTTSPTMLAPGEHSLTAVYSGDDTFAGSTSTAIEQTVYKAVLEVSGITAESKVADGSTEASIDTHAATLGGLLEDDDVSLSADSATGTFRDPCIGNDKEVVISGLTLSGSHVGRYVFVQPTTTADITPKATLTVDDVTAARKTYDGTTAATLNTSEAVLSGVIAPDDVYLESAATTGVFADSNVGTWQVITDGFVLGGEDACLYRIEQPVIHDVSIDPRPISVTAASRSKTYGDEDPSFTYSITDGSLVDGDDFSGELVRSPGEDVGQYPIQQGTLALSSNYDLTYIGAHLVIEPRELTIDFDVSDKTYDGSRAATIEQWTLNGLVNSDDVDITDGTAQFETQHVGTNKPVVATGFSLGGPDASNYELGNSTTTASITAREIAVTATSCTKVYDGTTACECIPAVTSGSLAATDTAVFHQVYVDRHVGSSKTLTPSGTVDDGNGGDNYAITFYTCTSGTVSPREITVVATTDTKEYDGTTSSTCTPVITDGSLGSGDTATWTQEFDTSSVGTEKLITPSGTISDGNSGDNYTVTLVEATDGEITTKELTLTSLMASDKEYDGTTSTAVVTDDATLNGVLPGDSVSVSGSATGAFNDRHAGTDKEVSVLGLELSGADADSYSLAQPTITATITPAPLTVSAVADEKEYDGTTDSLETPSITSGSLREGDRATWMQSFDTSSVGTGKILTPEGSVNDGNSGGNYDITYETSSSGTITALELTVTGITAEDKAYDDSTDATLATDDAELNGVLSDDEVTLDTSEATAEFEDEDVGTDKDVVITGLTLTGDDAENYSLTQPVVKADITAEPARLEFRTSPDEASPGDSFSSQPVVRVLDAEGDIVTTASVAVTLEITAGTGNEEAELSGTTTVDATDGLATFEGLSIDLAGEGYTLTATSDELTSATSEAFDVVSPPDLLVFSTSPEGTTSGRPFSTQPVVAVVDTDGTTVTSSTAEISLTITSGTGAAGAAISGTTTVTAEDGVATFSGVGIDLPGTGYTLEARSDGLVSATSNPFALTEPAIPPAPRLLTPFHLAEATYPIHFEWRDADSADIDSYILQIAADPDFMELLWVENELTNSSFTLEEQLPREDAATPYYWRVIASNSDGVTSEPSNIHAYRVKFSIRDVPGWALSVLSGMGGLVLMGTGLLVVRKRRTGDTAEE